MGGDVITDREIRDFLADPGTDESMNDQIIDEGIAEVRARMTDTEHSRRGSWGRVDADTPLVRAMQSGSVMLRMKLDAHNRMTMGCKD